MKQLLVGIVLLAVAAVILFWTNFETLFSDVESKGLASEITEWVKLAIAVITLLIGLVNLRLALQNKDDEL